MATNNLKHVFINLAYFWPSLIIKAWPVIIYSNFLVWQCQYKMMSILKWYVPFHSVFFFIGIIVNLIRNIECFDYVGLFIDKKLLTGGQEMQKYQKKCARNSTHNHSFRLVCAIIGMLSFIFCAILFFIWFGPIFWLNR